MTVKPQAIVQAMGVLGGVALVDLIGGTLVGMRAPQPPLIVIGAVGGLAASIAAGIILTRLQAWQAVGLRRMPHPSDLLWFTPFLIYALLPLAQGLRVSLPIAGMGVIFALSIGFWKVAALALAVHFLKTWGRLEAAILAGLGFGLMHLLALFVGAAVLPTLMNAVASGLLGFAIAALALRTGLSWPAAALYSLLLFSVALTGGLETPNMAPSVGALLPAIIISGLLAAVGLAALATTPRRATPAGGLAEG